MSNSTLATYTRISPNSNNPRENKILKITPHHMAGNLTVEQFGNLVANPARQMSANYSIGSDGRIGLHCEEKNRSWCSSSPTNDHQAITIEVANDGGAPDWHVSDKALASLISLCVDICQRNGIAKLNFTGNANGNLTQHNYFAATACPGPYLKSKFPYIAGEVNKRLGGSVQPTPMPTPTTGQMYRVRKTWTDAKSQIGAYTDLTNAKTMADKTPGYSVFDNAGKVVYSGKTTSTPAFKAYTVKVTADSLNIRKGPGTNFAINGSITNKGVYTIIEEATGAGAKLWGKLKSGAGWISLDFTQKR